MKLISGMIVVLMMIAGGYVLFNNSRLIGEDEIDLIATAPLKRVEALESVEMTISEGQIPLEQEKVTITIINSTDYRLMTGLMFTLEFLEDDLWKEVPMKLDHGFQSIGFTIESEENMSFIKDLSLFPLNRAGKYRIRKEVFIDEYPETLPLGEQSHHELVVEFERY